jgi:transposase
MYRVGLDVHSRRSSLEILDADGKLFKREQVIGPWAKLFEVIDQKVPRPFSICFEASCGYGYLYEQLSQRAQHVAVAHPGQLRLIFKAKKKNDRVDAGKLAKLLYLDAVPQVHVPNQDVRSWRGLIEYRRRLIDRRTGVKSQLRALGRGAGLDAPRGGRLWSGKGLAWLKEQPLCPGDALRREMMLDELTDLAGRLKRVEKELTRRGDAHPGVTLLRTAPGIGRCTAEAFLAYIDDVKRFARVARVGSYLGLVPCQDASAGANRLGHITRDGPPTVRKLLCEAAWQAARRSPTMKQIFERVSHGDKDRRKIAVVAVARHLAIALAAMLRSGEVWRESQGIRDARTVAVATDALRCSPPEDTDA